MAIRRHRALPLLHGVAVGQLLPDRDTKRWHLHRSGESVCDGEGGWWSEVVADRGGLEDAIEYLTGLDRGRV